MISYNESFVDYRLRKKHCILITKTTSLKIFKHYKLKPSFSKIKDEKAKDKVGVTI